MEAQPTEGERRRRIDLEMFGLGARVVREELEPAVGHPLEQDVAGVWPTVAVDGGEDHGVRLDQFRLERTTEPLLELVDRIGIDIGHVDSTVLVLCAHSCQIHTSSQADPER